MKKIICFAAAAAAAAAMLSGCGAGENEKKDYVMKVGNVVVSEESYEFIKDTLKKSGTAEGELEKKAKSEAEAMYKAIALGRAMKIEIDGTAATQSANQFKQQGMPEQLAADLSEAQQFMSKLANMAKKDLAEKDPSLLEEAKKGKWRAKHVLVLTQDVDEAELPAKKAIAEEILEKAKNGENFDKLIKEYNEDPGMASNPDGYVFGPGEMVQEFEDGVKNTPIGEFALVETSYGYHVIQPLELDDEAAVSAVTITDEQFNKFIDEKMKEYNLTVE